MQCRLGGKPVKQNIISGSGLIGLVLKTVASNSVAPSASSLVVSRSINLNIASCSFIVDTIIGS